MSCAMANDPNPRWQMRPSAPHKNRPQIQKQPCTSKNGKNDTQKRQIWEKVHGEQTGEYWDRLYDGIQREADRREFVRHIPKDYEPTALAYVTWPAPAVDVQHYLGHEYRALDPIRMDCRCFIVCDTPNTSFDSSTVTTFKIAGDEKHAVRKACARVRATIFQAYAASVTTQPLYIVRSVPRQPGGATVNLRPVEDMSSDCVLVRPELSWPTSTSLAFRKSKPDVATLKERYETLLHDIFEQTMLRMKYFPGALQLRFRLGQFVVSQYPKDTSKMGIDDFFQLTQHASFRGAIRRLALGDNSQGTDVSTRIRKRFTEIPDLLSPRDNIIHDLEQVGPEYVCILKLRSKDERGDLFNLKICYEERRDNIELTKTLWTRDIGDGGREEKPFMEMFVIDLMRANSGVLELCGAPVVDESRVPWLFEYQSKAVAFRLDDNTKRNPWDSDKAFLEVKESSFAELLSMQQKLIWRYNVRGTPYVCELAKILEFVPETGNFGMKKPVLGNHQCASSALKAGSPSWDLSMHDPEWQNSLAENAELKIGDEASWRSKWQAWFRERAATTSEFAEVFQMMQRLVQDE